MSSISKIQFEIAFTGHHLVYVWMILANRNHLFVGPKLIFGKCSEAHLVVQGRPRRNSPQNHAQLILTYYYGHQDDSTARGRVFVSMNFTGNGYDGIPWYIIMVKCK